MSSWTYKARWCWPRLEGGGRPRPGRLPDVRPCSWRCSRRPRRWPSSWFCWRWCRSRSGILGTLSPTSLKKKFTERLFNYILLLYILLNAQWFSNINSLHTNKSLFLAFFLNISIFLSSFLNIFSFFLHMMIIILHN